MRRADLIRLLLAVVTALVYFRATSFGFVNLDDPGYVATNPRVQAGLPWDNVTWAFTSLSFSNWHPLTWLSYMFDCQVFGLNPFANHLVNLLLHVMNSMLLFTVLMRMTGAMWRSALVAALFALHPLHVESVAWIAERKDVLSTFFWLLAMGCYVRYVNAPTLGRYVAVLVCAVLGLMAKSMVVTLPCVLLLLDYWPLRRFETGMPLRRLVLEKVPLFALSAVSCVLTFIAQRQGGSMDRLANCPFLGARVPNALVTYATYIGKMLWPTRLAIPYPHPGVHFHGGAVAISVLFLASVTVLVIWRAKRSPYLIVGWFWYLGTLVPVIGLLQVGIQSMADRYTYVPLIGLFIMIAWGLAEVFVRAFRYRPMLRMAAVVWLAALSICSWVQVGYWRDSFTLFEHTLSVTSDNVLAETNMGHAYLVTGQYARAEQHLRRACRLAPDYDVARSNLGHALVFQGRLDDAAEFFSGYLKNKPDDVTSLAGMASVYVAQGNDKQAEDNLVKVLKQAPGNLSAVTELASLLIRQKRYDEAEARCQDAVTHEPYNEELRANLNTIREIRRR